MSIVKSHKTSYITKDYKTKMFEGDKVIIRYEGKTFTCFITRVGSKWLWVRNGIYQYQKHSNRHGKYQDWLNTKTFDIEKIEGICLYPSISQKEPVQLSLKNWKYEGR